MNNTFFKENLEIKKKRLRDKIIFKYQFSGRLVA